jgi:phosphoribosylamine--glycine ligase
VVAVADDYPRSYQRGQRIHGLDDIVEDQDLVVFHSGTERRLDGAVHTNGGRVLSVTAMGKTLRAALDRCYETLGRIRFQGMRCRQDIGKR